MEEEDQKMGENGRMRSVVDKKGELVNGCELRRRWIEIELVWWWEGSYDVKYMGFIIGLCRFKNENKENGIDKGWYVKQIEYDNIEFAEVTSNL